LRTLLLDSTYFPVKIVSWQRAMILLLTGRAEVILEYTERRIRSVNQSFTLPKILRLHSRHLSNRAPKFSRLNVFVRDRFTCQYCSLHLPPSQLTLDHVLPASRGGALSWENIVASCAKCNTLKGNRTPSEAKLTLLKVPRPPKWSPTLCLRMKEDDPIEWSAWFPTKKDRAV
jgi:5-methylcytosine-specific restriction endonuclease McrA